MEINGRVGRNFSGFLSAPTILPKDPRFLSGFKAAPTLQDKFLLELNMRDKTGLFTRLLIYMRDYSYT